MTNQNLELEGIILNGSEERIKLIDKTGDVFGRKIYDTKKLNEFAEWRSAVMRVKIGIQINLLNLGSLGQEKGSLAQQAASIFSREFILLEDIQKEFFGKLTLGVINAKWASENLNIDKLNAIASELVKEKLSEQIILSNLNELIYKEKAA